MLKRPARPVNGSPNSMGRWLQGQNNNQILAKPRGACNVEKLCAFYRKKSDGRNRSARKNEHEWRQSVEEAVEIRVLFKTLSASHLRFKTSWFSLVLELGSLRNLPCFDNSVNVNFEHGWSISIVTIQIRTPYDKVPLHFFKKAKEQK